MNTQGYLFRGDQVGFEISPPLYRLLDPFLRVLEFPGGKRASGLCEPSCKGEPYHLATLMYRGMVSGLSRNLTSHG